MPLKTQKRQFKKIALKHGAKKRVKRIAPKKMTYLDNTRLSPYPPQFNTKFHTSIYGSFPAGLINANLQILLNSCVTPFDFSTTPFPGARPAPVTLHPTGFQSLCNGNLYTSYRVTGMKVKIDLMPEALSDTVICTLTPALRQGLPPTAEQAMTQPFTKKGLFSSSKDDRNSKQGSSITLFFRLHEFLGINKMILDNDISGQFNSPFNTAPTRSIWCTLNLATPDGLATARPVSYRIDMVQYVDLYDVANANLVQ